MATAAVDPSGDPAAQRSVIADFHEFPRARWQVRAEAKTVAIRW